VLAQQLILYGENEACACLRTAIVIERFDHFARILVHVIHTLRLTRDTVGALEACVEPLGRIWGEPLIQDHVNKLVIDYLRQLALLDHALVHQCGNPEIDHAMGDLPHRHLMPGHRDAGAAEIL